MASSSAPAVLTKAVRVIVAKAKTPDRKVQDAKGVLQKAESVALIVTVPFGQAEKLEKFGQSKFFQKGKKDTDVAPAWLRGDVETSSFAPSTFVNGLPPLLKPGAGVAFVANTLSKRYTFDKFSEQITSDAAYDKQVYKKFKVNFAIAGELREGGAVKGDVGSLQFFSSAKGEHHRVLTLVKPASQAAPPLAF